MTNTTDTLTDNLNLHGAGQGEPPYLDSNGHSDFDKRPVVDFLDEEESRANRGYSRFKNQLSQVYQALQKSLKKLKSFWQTYPLFVTIGTFFAVVMLVAMWVLFFTAVYHPTVPAAANHDNPQMAHLVDEVSKMQSQLIHIDQALKAKPNTENDIVKLEAQMHTLTTSVSQLATQMNETLASSIQNSDLKLQEGLSAVSQSLDAMKQTKQPIQYLKPSDLPFEVIAIDSIEGQPIVSANYDYKTTPLDVGFNLAGWELLNANYAKQRAEFVNKQHQHVVIQLDKLGV